MANDHPNDPNYYQRGKINTSTTSCSACKYQRKGCKKDCILREHFPSSKDEEFSQVQKVFGVSNITKMITGHDKKSPSPRPLLSLPEQRQVVESLCWEGKSWHDDPIRGPYGVLKKLEQERDQLIQFIQYYQLSQRHMPMVNSWGARNNSGNGMESLAVNNNNYLINSVQGPESSRQVGLLDSQPRFLQQQHHNETVSNQRIMDNGSSNVTPWSHEQGRNGNMNMNWQGTEDFLTAQHCIPDIIKPNGKSVARAGNRDSNSRMNELQNNVGQGYHHIR